VKPAPFSVTKLGATHNPASKNDAMDKFISRFADRIMGVLSGFDRLVFRGHLLPLIRDGGMYTFAGVRLLDFKGFVTKASDAIKQAALAEAEAAGRPVRYLESSVGPARKTSRGRCSTSIPSARGWSASSRPSSPA
jgi:hypothetical protein